MIKINGKLFGSWICIGKCAGCGALVFAIIAYPNYPAITKCQHYQHCEAQEHIETRLLPSSGSFGNLYSLSGYPSTGSTSAMFTADWSTIS